MRQSCIAFIRIKIKVQYNKLRFLIIIGIISEQNSIREELINFMRASGILMPIFSLSSDYGIGTFGKEAFDFVDFLKKSGQSYWQILPINPTNYGDSPYQSFSSAAGNPYFIDLRLLEKDGLLEKNDYVGVDFGRDETKVDYEKLYNNRFPVLRKAYNRFKNNISEEYVHFCAKNAFWLDDYALFMAIKDSNGGKSFTLWEDAYRFRNQKALEQASTELSDDINFYKTINYFFYKQWNALKKYANKNGIKIIGDMPMYVALDSADVWGCPEQFLLDGDLKPVSVAGCPPDAFSNEGQLWGNPLYDWKKMEKDGYSWWKQRMSVALETYDIIRIDHFRGFESFYTIPFGSKNAVKGKWVKGPGMKLFNSLKERFGPLPIIAEDLGFLTKEVRKLLNDSAFPGMKVLQFAFDSREESDYLPHNYTNNCVVYTGTHDNDTINGWAKTAPKSDVKFAEKYMHLDKNEGLNWCMMRTALMSVADTCILMMPDLLGSGSEARINTPGTVGENWRWRIAKGCINDWLAAIVLENTKLYGRMAREVKL